MGVGNAQEINNTASFNTISSDSYIRLTVDNDFFTGTDEQYSEGVNIELVTPWLKKNPLQRLLVHPHFHDISYGMGIEQAGYTPFDLPNEGKPYNDRPYAGTFYLKTFLIANDPDRQQRFTTTLSTGIIGPASFAAQFQDNIHVLTDNVWPPGWRYQIKNDILLNYQVNYEREVLYYDKYFVANAACTARAGTFSDKVGAGWNVMAGLIPKAFNRENKSKSVIQVYLFDNPEIDLVAYDATLQGGLFVRSSPYTIPASAITRVQFINRAGMAVTIHRVHIEYSEYYITSQFNGGPVHLYGGLQVAYAFNGGNN